MKQLATVIAFVSSAALASPVFACPNMDHDEAPRTAEKDKAPPKDTAAAPKAPKTEQPKDTAAGKDQKPADAKAKDAKKPADKVSIK